MPPPKESDPNVTHQPRKNTSLSASSCSPVAARNPPLYANLRRLLRRLTSAVSATKPFLLTKPSVATRPATGNFLQPPPTTPHPPPPPPPPHPPAVGPTSALFAISLSHPGKLWVVIRGVTMKAAGTVGSPPLPRVPDLAIVTGTLT